MTPETRALVDEAKESLSPECCELLDRATNAFEWMEPADLIALLAAEAEFYRRKVEAPAKGASFGYSRGRAMSEGLDDEWLKR